MAYDDLPRCLRCVLPVYWRSVDAMQIVTLEVSVPVPDYLDADAASELAHELLATVAITDALAAEVVAVHCEA